MLHCFAIFADLFNFFNATCLLRVCCVCNLCDMTAATSHKYTSFFVTISYVVTSYTNIYHFHRPQNVDRLCWHLDTICYLLTNATVVVQTPWLLSSHNLQHCFFFVAVQGLRQQLRQLYITTQDVLQVRHMFHKVQLEKVHWYNHSALLCVDLSEKTSSTTVCLSDQILLHHMTHVDADTSDKCASCTAWRNRLHN